MNNLFGQFWSSVRQAVPMLICYASHTAFCSAAPTNSTPIETFDYAEPGLLTGTLYAAGSDHKVVLFTFQRSATRSGSTVHVECLFTRPDGSTGAVENLVYESGQLVSYQMKDLQAGLWGSILIYPDPKKPDRQKISINHGRDSDTKHKGTVADLPKNTVIDDTLYPFILAHWDKLERGATVKFRFVSLEREETTYGFKLAKATEDVMNGKLVVCIRMEPTSLIVARFLDPLYFSLENDAPHRLVEYVGRTTPRVKKGKAWKYLDADTVFDWK